MNTPPLPTSPKAEATFLAALECAPAEREALVAAACADDAALGAEVRAMLALHGKAGAFMQGPAHSPEIGGELARLKPEAEGERIGRYTLLQEIGEGGFGTVWMAEQMEPVSRKVALKIIKLGMDTREVIGRFEQERQALAMMDHPNIAMVFDAGATQLGRPFFVMELVKGVPITQYCDEAGLGTRERLALFGDVCSAINHAHQKGIIHRDIKPSNVMITLHGDRPVVKVIDFGIAKATQGKLTDQTLFTRFEQFVGTPVYMSPEQAGMSGLDVDTRSDIYALGILLYELLTGKPPFDAKALASAGHDEMRRIIREVEPVKPSSRLGTIAGEERTTVAKARHVEAAKVARLVEPDLDWIVMKAIDKDRDRRYETANGLALDIQRHLRDEMVIARPPTAAYRVSRLIRRHRREFATGCAASLLLTALAVWFVINLRAKERRAVAGEERALAATGRATAAANEALENAKATRRALAQAHVAVADSAFLRNDRTAMVQALDAVPDDLRDQRWAYLSAKRDASLGGLNVPGLADAGAVAAVPGQPAQFAVADAEGKVTIVDVKTGTTLMNGKVDLAGAPVLAVAADGARLALTTRGAREIHLLRASDGQPQQTVPAPSASISGVVFSPDSSLLATTDGPEGSGRDAHLSLVDLRDGSVRWQVDGGYSDLLFSADGGRLFVGSRGGLRKFRIVDVATGQILTERDGYLFCMAMSRDGKLLALGLQRGEVAIIDAANGDELRRARLHRGEVTGMAWTAAGHLLTLGNELGVEETGNAPRLLRLWDPATFEARGTFFGTTQGGRDFGWDFQPASGYLLTAESPPQLWRIPADREAARIACTSEQGWSVCFLSDTRLLARKDYHLAPYDLSDPHQPRELSTPVENGDVLCAVHWRAGWMATARRINGPGAIKLYKIDGDALTLEHEIPLPDWTMRMDFDAPGERLLALARGPATEIFATASGESLLKLPVQLDRAVFSGKAGHFIGLVSRQQPGGGPANELILFDSKTGDRLKTIAFHQRLHELVTSPDRRHIAIAGEDQIVRILDADTLEERGSYRAHDAAITAMTFHPSLPILATAANDGAVKVWDYETAHERHKFLGIDGIPVMLAFSPNGRHLALEAQGHTVRIFDLAIE